MLISSASAPCSFAKSNTFCPASSGDTTAEVVPPVRSVATSRIARTVVEIVQ